MFDTKIFLCQGFAKHLHILITKAEHEQSHVLYPSPFVIVHRNSDPVVSQST